MDPVALRGKLIAVLGQIQADSDLECPALTGATKPESLPKFDSKVWPVATTILATALGATIPNGHEHLRRRDDRAPAFHRRDSHLHRRFSQEAKRRGSGGSMTKLDSAKRAQIAERLKEARKLAGLVTRPCRQMIGLHRPSVTEMEGGNRRVSADELAPACRDI